jgi:hypothetical protein
MDDKIKDFKIGCQMGTPSYSMPWSIYEIMQMIEYMEADEWSETFDNWYLAVGMTHMKELAQCTTKDDDMLFKSIIERKKLWDELSSRFGKITNTRAKATNKNKGVDVIRIFDKAQNGI